MQLECLKSLPYDDDPEAEVCAQCPGRYGLCPEDVVMDPLGDARNIRVGGHLFRIVEGTQQAPVPLCVHPRDFQDYRVRLEKQKTEQSPA